MSNKYLSFITDKELIDLVVQLHEKGKKIKANAPKKFYKNVIDPFAAIMQSSAFELNHEDWTQLEIERQYGKSLSNAIGAFHEDILGSVDGWKNVGKDKNITIDLVCEEKKIIAEVKNKHNTVKKSDEYKVYEVLEELIESKSSVFKSYTAFYVKIIPSKPERYNTPFTPPVNKTGKCKPQNNRIRVIDGASFYELVTGQHDALENLFTILPDLISEQMGNNKIKEEHAEYSKYFKRAYKK